MKIQIVGTLVESGDAYSTEGVVIHSSGRTVNVMGLSQMEALSAASVIGKKVIITIEPTVYKNQAELIAAEEANAQHAIDLLEGECDHDWFDVGLDEPIHCVKCGDAKLPKRPREDPPPSICQHDDPSWCTAECWEQARKFREWLARQTP